MPRTTAVSYTHLRVHEQGVKFGIWIEPEMVNEDSYLYRAHPDWAIRIPGKKPVRSRNQLLLDFSRKEVRDCVFDQICAVPVSYTHLFYRYQEPYFCRGESVEMRVSGRFIRQIKW